MAAEGGFTWDIDKVEDKARYVWPRDWVLEWWAEPWDWDALGTEAGRAAAGVWKHDIFFSKEVELHRAQDGRELFGEPAPTPAGRDGTAAQRLRDVLVDRGGAWLTAFAGRTWDPFHLPLFDPSTGTLSPKHPARKAADGWDDEIRALFDAAVRERIEAL